MLCRDTNTLGAGGGVLGHAARKMLLHKGTSEVPFGHFSRIM